MWRLLARQEKDRERRDELLSAYIDGELSAGEQLRLEAQLETDPALQAELEALRRTVALVRDLPPAPLPRNFILPQTAAPRLKPVKSARPRRAWAAPLLTAATSIVSLLFVAVLAGDLLFSGVGGLASMPREAPPAALEAAPHSEDFAAEEAAVEVAEETVVEEAEIEKAAPVPSEPPMPAQALPGAEQRAAEAPEGIEATVPVEDASPIERPAAPPVLEDTEPTVPAAGGGPVGEPVDLAPLASPAGETEALPTPTAPAQENAAVATPTPAEAGKRAPLVTGEEQPAEAEREWAIPEEGTSRRTTPPPWRVLEIVLGLSAVGLALVTVWAWRARRR